MFPLSCSYFHFLFFVFGPVSLLLCLFVLYEILALWPSVVQSSCPLAVGGALVLGKLPVPGRPTILITVGQGPTVLAVGAGVV